MSISPIILDSYSISPEGQELIVHGTPMFPIAFYHDDLELMTVPWHWHEEMEAVYIESGETVIFAGMEKYKLRKGQAAFINSNVLHAGRGIPGTGCRYHSMVFHPNLIGGEVESVFWQTYLRPLMTSGSRSVIFDGSEVWHIQAQDAIERAWQEGAYDQPGFEFRVRNALSELIFLICLHLPEAGKPATAKMKRDNGRIRQMLQFIDENIADQITIADIAASASISESECLRCFRTTLGYSPIRCLKRLRIHKAANMLLSTEDKIGEISFACGFPDVSYFIRAFREVKGMTPGEFRKRADNSTGSASRSST